MKRTLIYLCTLCLGIQTVLAHNEEPIARLLLPPVYTSQRFISQVSCRQYFPVERFKKSDSVKSVYRNSIDAPAEKNTDYLPLTGGTLTGPLEGVSGTFSAGVAATGANFFQAGASGLSVPVVSFGLTPAYPQFTINTFNQTSAAAYLGWNIQSATTSSDDSKYILSNYATKITGGDGSFHFFTAASGTAGNTVAFTDVLHIANNGNTTIAGSITAGAADFTSAAFREGVAATGANSFQAGVAGLAAPVASFGLTPAYPQFTVNTFNQTSAAAYLGWNIQSATNSSDASKYILSNYATKITGGDGSFHFFTAASGTAGNTVAFTDVFSIANNGNVSANGTITTKKITVTQTGWSDYVFNKEYKLRSLSSLECTFIKTSTCPRCRLQRKWKRMASVLEKIRRYC